MGNIQFLDKKGLVTLVKKIKNDISTMYDIKGSALYADQSIVDAGTYEGVTSTGLWKLVDSTYTKVVDIQQGDVYNIINSFTTDNNFIEGEGKTVESGINIVAVKQEDIIKFDCLSLGLALESITDSEITSLFK